MLGSGSLSPHSTALAQTRLRPQPSNVNLERFASFHPLLNKQDSDGPKITLSPPPKHKDTASALKAISGSRREVRVGLVSEHNVANILKEMQRVQALTASRTNVLTAPGSYMSKSKRLPTSRPGSSRSKSASLSSSRPASALSMLEQSRRSSSAATTPEPSRPSSALAYTDLTFFARLPLHEEQDEAVVEVRGGIGAAARLREWLQNIPEGGGGDEGSTSELMEGDGSTGSTFSLSPLSENDPYGRTVCAHCFQPLVVGVSLSCGHGVHLPIPPPPLTLS